MRFSVVIPVYNKVETIETAIESVLSQSCPDLELIIVDDGSTDRLEEVLRKYSQRVRTIRQPNSGVSVARNTGIRAAQGEFVCFLDADDVWREDHLQVLSDMIGQYPRGEYFLTSHQVHMPDGPLLGSSRFLGDKPQVFECTDLLGLLNDRGYGAIHTNSVCIAKDVFFREDIWFEPGARIGEDTDVWYRAALKRSVVVTKEETTVYHREHSTATKDTNHTDDWAFYRRRAELLADEDISEDVKRSVEETYDRYLLTGSREHMIQGDRKIAKAILKKVSRKKGKRYWLGRVFVLLPVSWCKTAYRLLLGG